LIGCIVCVYNNNFIESKTSPSTPGVYSGNNTISLLLCSNISKRLKHKKKIEKLYSNQAKYERKGT